MLIKGTEDLRVQKTMAAIDRAFSELLVEKDYEKITVKELCGRAYINKKTFYAYYADLDGLLQEKLEWMSRGFIGRIAALRAPEDLADINREFFLYAVEQGELYEKIICSGAYRNIACKMLSGLVRDTWRSASGFQALGSLRQNLLLAFLAVTGGELYRQWVRDGKKLPLEEIIALSGELLFNGVNGFMRMTGRTFCFTRLKQ